MTLDLLFSPNMQPFAIALGVVLGLVVLELVLMVVGVSILGDNVDPSLDAEPSLDIDADLDVESGIDVELDGAEDVTGGGALVWLGLGDVPFAIWLATLLTAFGLIGYVLQGVLNSIIGSPLPALIASVVALPFALAITARFARFFGRLVPKFESTAISSRSFGGRRGVITVGTARRGHPAQARIKDGYGNTHYTMVEPLNDSDAFSQGTEIATVRLGDGSLRAISLEDSTT